jgi:hypothetical protein
MPDEYRNRGRLFSDIYDGHIQASNFTLNDPVGRNSYLGRLRLDAFLSKTIVVVDADIVDGAFVLDAASDAFIESLPLNQIEVMLRVDSFEEVILASFCDPSRSTLNPYFLSSVPVDQAIEVQQQLSKYPSSGVTSWRAIPRILREVGLNPELANRYEVGWDKWIDLIDRRRSIGAALWNKGFEFREIFGNQIELEKSEVDDVLKTPLGRGVMASVWEKRNFRSQVIGLIAQAREEPKRLTIDELSELATIEWWYNAAYNRTRAANHNCGHVEITCIPEMRRFNGNLVFIDDIMHQLRDFSVPSSSEKIIEVPLALADALAKLDAETFAAIKEDLEITENMEEWHTGHDINDLRRAVDKFVRQVDGCVSIGDRSFLSTKVIPLVRLIAESATRDYGRDLGRDIGGLLGGSAAQAGGSIGALVGAGLGIGARQLTPVVEEVSKQRRQERIVNSIVEVAVQRATQSN